MTAAVIDTGPLVAALNRGDPDHDACAAIVVDASLDLIAPALVLVEVDYWRKKSCPRSTRGPVSPLR